MLFHGLQSDFHISANMASSEWIRPGSENPALLQYRPDFELKETVLAWESNLVVAVAKLNVYGLCSDEKLNSKHEMLSGAFPICEFSLSGDNESIIFRLEVCRVNIVSR